MDDFPKDPKIAGLALFTHIPSEGSRMINRSYRSNFVGPFIAAIMMIAVSSCGGGGGGGATPPPPPPANVSPGGLWIGVDSNGGDIVAIVTETGRFHFLTLDDLSQGSGIISVSNVNNLSGDFQLVTQLGFVFADGTTLANCTLSGTVTERQTMTVTVNCTTTAGLQSQSTATLNYDASYDRDSSLAAIAGNYQGISAVLNITGDGTIFSQDAATGCVVNGQVGIIDAAFNAYDFGFTYNNCLGQEAILNGSTFSGIAALDNTGNPEVLIVTATGTVGAVLVSFIQALDRI